MIAKGKSISHGTAALEYDLAKEINGEAAATEIHRHELFGCTGEEMVQEMKPYFVDFPNVKNNCLRFEVSPSVEESAGMTDADWAKLGNDFMQRMGLMNHQYIIVKHSGTEKNSRQAHLHILANRVSLSGELYKDNWIGKRATEAANSIARERNLVQSKDIGKANREEIKQAMDGILARMQGFDLAEFSRELEKLGFRVREARASTGKLNGYYVTSRSGTEYKASEIGKGYTLAHIEKTQKNLKYNSISRNYGNTWKIQCKLPPKTKRFCPLKTFNNAPLKSLDRWGYYYFSLFPSVCSHFTDTFSCQLNPVRRMYNTIHNGICYCRVSDCIIPIVRWQLRGDDDGLAPMSVLYYIEQDGSFLGIKVHKEEVIQYEQRAPFDSLEFRFQCAFYFCHLKRTHKFRSIRIICPYALLAGFIPHCCGKEALPGTG